MRVVQPCTLILLDLILLPLRPILVKKGRISFLIDIRTPQTVQTCFSHKMKTKNGRKANETCYVHLAECRITQCDHHQKVTAACNKT